MNEDFTVEIRRVLDDPRLELDPALASEAKILRLQEFCELLQKWNRRINLTAERELVDILQKHVFDSLHYLRWINPGGRVIDIGSGGGFPGIPVKILQSGIEVSLLESQRKRCSFLREAVRLPGLEGAEVLEGRAEAFSIQPEYAGKFDRVLFRGFSSIQECLVTGLPFLKDGGRVVLVKDPAEMTDWDAARFPSVRLTESREVTGFHNLKSLAMVFEQCSTWNTDR